MIPRFGARLRSHRERRGIDLDTIARSTKIGVGILEGLERDDISRWPSGIFRRGFIRAYARAVGLDPESTLKEFLEWFPDPNPEVRGAFVDPSRLTLADKRDSSLGAADCVQPMPPRWCDIAGEPLRLTLADEPRRSVRSRARPASWPWRRLAAGACDVVVVTAIAAAVFAVAGMFWTPFTVTTVCYYFAGVLVAGTSPAAWVFGRGPRRPAARLHAAAPKLEPQTGVAETDLTVPFAARRYPRAV
jgi:hypothetical protein